MRLRRSILPLLAVVAVVAGCGMTSERVQTPPETMAPQPVWPPPPNRPRILFVKVVASPADLGIRPSMWQRVTEFLVGKEEEWLIRPTGVAANGQRIVVADPGAQALWVLDIHAGRFHRIREAGGHRLVSPVAVALGPNDRIYLADSFVGSVFIFAADGSVKGTISGAGLQRPAGVAYSATTDRLYVADSAAHHVAVFSRDGRALGAIGQRGTGDGEFNFPTHVAVDREGVLYVTDALGFRVQMFQSDGTFAGQFGRHGDTSGDFALPKGIAVDSEGHIYVVETLFDAVQIFDRGGRFLLSFGERGLGAGQFWLPSGLFIDPQDRIYVADAYNQRIQIFQYLKAGRDE